MPVKIDMVCYEEGSAQCIISNMMPGATKKRLTLLVRPSYKVSQLFSDIKCQLDVDNFDISLQTSKEEEEVIVSHCICASFLNDFLLFGFQTIISENEDKTLSEIGIDFSSKKHTTIKLIPANSSVHRRSAIITSEADTTLPNSLDDDELALGASASPVEPNSSPIPLPLFSEEPTTRSHNDSITLYPSKSR